MDNKRLNSFFKNGISITFGLGLAFAGLAASRAVFDGLFLAKAVEQNFSINNTEVSEKDSVTVFKKDSLPLKSK
jgi:hypothetical protein